MTHTLTVQYAKESIWTTLFPYKFSSSILVHSTTHTGPTFSQLIKIFFLTFPFTYCTFLRLQENRESKKTIKIKLCIVTSVRLGETKTTSLFF